MAEIIHAHLVHLMKYCNNLIIALIAFFGVTTAVSEDSFCESTKRILYPARKVLQ